MTDISAIGPKELHLSREGSKVRGRGTHLSRGWGGEGVVHAMVYGQFDIRDVHLLLLGVGGVHTSILQDASDVA